MPAGQWISEIEGNIFSTTFALFGVTIVPYYSFHCLSNYRRTVRFCFIFGKGKTEVIIFRAAQHYRKNPEAKGQTN